MTTRDDRESIQQALEILEAEAQRQERDGGRIEPSLEAALEDLRLTDQLTARFAPGIPATHQRFFDVDLVRLPLRYRQLLAADPGEWIGELAELLEGCDADAAQSHSLCVLIEAVCLQDPRPLARSLPELAPPARLFVALNDRPILRRAAGESLGFAALPDLLELLGKRRLLPRDLLAAVDMVALEPQIAGVAGEAIRRYVLDDPYVCFDLAGYRGFGKLRSANLLYLLAIDPEAESSYAQCLQADSPDAVRVTWKALPIHTWAQPVALRAIVLGLWRTGRGGQIGHWLDQSRELVQYHVHGSPEPHLRDTDRLADLLKRR